MKLEYGKRYVRRDGNLSAPLERSPIRRFPFRCEAFHVTYRENGTWTIAPSEHDLVRELGTADSDSRHTLDMCDALNTRIDQYASTPEANRLVLLAEMLEYALAIHETATIEATKAQAKETAVDIAETLRQLVSGKCEAQLDTLPY